MIEIAGASLPGKIAKVSVIADALPKEFQKAFAPIDGTRWLETSQRDQWENPRRRWRARPSLPSLRLTQGFTAGTRVVGKAVSGRCFAFWNTVLSAEAQGTCH